MARARISLPVPLSPVMRTPDVRARDAPGERHHLAHVADGDGAAAFGGQLVDRPERRLLFAIDAGPLEIAEGGQQQVDGVDGR